VELARAPTQASYLARRHSRKDVLCCLPLVTVPELAEPRRCNERHREVVRLDNQILDVDQLGNETERAIDLKCAGT
jgi:hypothetical protein